MRGRAGRYGAMCILLSGALVGGGACLPWGLGPPVFGVGADLVAEWVVFGAAEPTALAFAPDGRIFYTEKNTGRIRLIADNRLLDEPFATVPVNTAGARGLLGLALHPDFVRNGRVYVFYTRSATAQATTDPQLALDNRVVYFEAAGNVANGGEVFVLALPTGLGLDRISGRLAFAADRSLLIGIGDTADPPAALNDGVLVGKVLRYLDDGTIPADNPVAGSPVYARGLRDVAGLTLDPLDGTLFVLDQYASGVQEINRIQPGASYGWPEVQGVAGAAYVAAHPGYVEPFLATAAGRLVAGASFNPSTRYGDVRKLDLFYGEVHGRRVIRVQLSGLHTAVVSSETFASGLPDAVTDVAFNPAGTLYVATRGAIYRIVPR